MIAQRMPTETNDAVNLIVSLLVRFPEITSVRSNQTDQTLRLTFAFSTAFTRAQARRLIDGVLEHLGAYHEVSGGAPVVLGADCDVDQGASFLHVDRDLKSISKEEIAMLVDLLREGFGEHIVANPVPEESSEEDVSAQDEMVNVAIDSVREGGAQKSLVGFREERRVLIYFTKAAKKKKAAKK
ncbi:MAG TPA: hypothetical protein VNJ51_04720 [Candidatus Dormibacteraeota bacterium]|nr:hypothetical protein [Candidatus Dormibacteraeota bacterium]